MCRRVVLDEKSASPRPLEIIVMIDKHKPKTHEPFKMRSVFLDLDEYLKVFILPQIPSEYRDFRDSVKDVSEKMWREMYLASFTSGRERQRHLLLLKVELVMIDTYLKEIRDICYRGKAKKRLDAHSARRFEVFSKKYKDAINILWAWSKNEEKKKTTAGIEKVSGLLQGEM